MKQLLIMVLKGCPFVGASLYSLFVPSGIVGRAGSDVSMSYIFPQGMLTVITLVGAGAGADEARARVRCTRVSPLLSGQDHLIGERLGPKLLEQKRLGLGLSWLCSL